MKPDGSQPFPWAQVMQFGFSVLKLPSEQFWAMTPREMAYAMQAYTPANIPPLVAFDFRRAIGPVSR